MEAHADRPAPRTPAPRSQAWGARLSWDRVWWAATATAVVVGIVVQVTVSATGPPLSFAHGWERALNVFAFFTVLSNLAVAASCALLAVRPGRAATPPAAALRMTALVAITITGLVYHVALAGLLELDTWGLLANELLHTVVPVMAVVGWLVWGPRGAVSARITVYALAFPVAWLAFTLVRGAIVDFYPYPFVDVVRLGYVKVAFNCVWVAVLFVGFAAGYTALDRFLVRVQAGRPAPAG